MTLVCVACFSWQHVQDLTCFIVWRRALDNYSFEQGAVKRRLSRSGTNSVTIFTLLSVRSSIVRDVSECGRLEADFSSGPAPSTPVSVDVSGNFYSEKTASSSYQHDSSRFWRWTYNSLRARVVMSRISTGLRITATIL